MSELKRTLLITGASSGIGRATAKKMLKLGHHVIGTSRQLSRLDISAANFSPFVLDLENLQHLPVKLKELVTNFPEIDAAVCCAGYGRFGSLEEFSYSQIQSLINTNFTAQAFLARALIPHLKEKISSDLIFIGSEAAIKGSRKGAIYCAGKFALRGFAQALREECARGGVRVSIINPGMVKTAFFDLLDFEPGEDQTNFIRPEDVAEAVYYVLNANPDIVIDEINLNPSNRVVKFKKIQGR